MIAEVVGLGARNPLGLSALQVAMGLRAGLFEPRSIPQLDKHGEEIGIALTGGLGRALHGHERMIALAAPALSEAVHDLPEALAPSETHPLPLLLGLPEPGRPDERRDVDLLAAIAERSGVAIDREASETLAQGQPSFAFALERAKALLDGGRDAVIVGAVDSYYDPRVLAWLDEHHRLDGLYAEDGFIPSEAAAFLVLTRGQASLRRGRILDVETGREPSVHDDDAPNVAEAMTDLLWALDARKQAPFSWSIADVNGEEHRTREWLWASSRVLPAEHERTKWVWEMGDSGAATGPLFAAVALQLCALGVAPAHQALIALHAEGPERGALIVEGRPPEVHTEMSDTKGRAR